MAVGPQPLPEWHRGKPSERKGLGKHRSSKRGSQREGSQRAGREQQKQEQEQLFDAIVADDERGSDAASDAEAAAVPGQTPPDAAQQRYSSESPDRAPALAAPSSRGRLRGSSMRREEEAKMRKLFSEADTDGSGTLQLKEVRTLCRNMGDRISATALEEGFWRMDPEKTGKVNYEQFQKWWRLKEDTARRELRKNVEQVFRMTDQDGSGKLDREEVAAMAAKISRKYGAEFEPPFDLDADFADMDTCNTGLVDFKQFATWFKYRTGDDEPEIPVLPEFMVRKVGTLSAQVAVQQVGGRLSRRISSRRKQNAAVESSRKDDGDRPTRSGKRLWSFLRPRLGIIVSLQRQWGRVTDLYGTGGTLFESSNIPDGICK